MYKVVPSGNCKPKYCNLCKAKDHITFNCKGNKRSKFYDPTFKLPGSLNAVVSQQNTKGVNKQKNEIYAKINIVKGEVITDNNVNNIVKGRRIWPKCTRLTHSGNCKHKYCNLCKAKDHITFNCKGNQFSLQQCLYP